MAAEEGLVYPPLGLQLMRIVLRPRSPLTKSPYAEYLDLVQTQFTGVLRPLGFRKAGRTFNRSSPDGLTQVITLQIRRPDPVPPPLLHREAPRPHDSFTVNLGVWIPEVSQYHLLAPRSRTIQEYDCHIRERLGLLLTPPLDTWWPLGPDWSRSAALALDALQGPGMAFLAIFGSRDGVVAHWIDRAPDSRIVVAIIEAKRGRPERARELLLQQIAGSSHSGHQGYVRTIAEGLGLEPIPRG